jgi:hypothetical protein
MAAVSMVTSPARRSATPMTRTTQPDPAAKLWAVFGQRCQPERDQVGLSEIGTEYEEAPLVSGAFCMLGAEGVGFEPTETRNASPVFKTGAIGH